MLYEVITAEQSEPDHHRHGQPDDREVLGAVEGLGAAPAVFPEIPGRITSYNVCYTKLLRIPILRIDSGQSSRSTRGYTRPDHARWKPKQTRTRQRTLAPVRPGSSGGVATPVAPYRFGHHAKPAGAS